MNKSRIYLLSRMTPRRNVFDTLDLDIHQRKRKIVSQPISERSMRSFEPKMISEIEVFIKKLTESSRRCASVNLTELCGNLAGDIVGQLAFRYPLQLQTSEKNAWLMSGLALVGRRSNVYMQFPVLGRLEPLVKVMVRKVRRRYLNIIETMIKARTALPEGDIHDFNSHASKMGDLNSDLKSSELWAEVFFFIGASGSTTATAMSALFFYLSRYPTCYETLASDSISPGCFTVDGHEVPDGTEVAVNLHSLHHNEEYFPEPFKFKPERWLGGSENGGPDQNKAIIEHAFAPFMVGSRVCPGKAMAYLEISLAIAHALWRFEFKAATGREGLISSGGYGKGGGMERMNGFQIYDHFTASHEGPMLIFEERRS